jgi:hypothetical protein
MSNEIEDVETACDCEKVDRCVRDLCPKCCYCGAAIRARAKTPDPAVVLSAALDVLDNLSASPVEGYLVPEHIVERLRRAVGSETSENAQKTHGE